MTARLTFVHTLSSLHAGTGQGTGVIDLPIAREKATNLPFLPGSSLKGALRSRCVIRGKSGNCERIFGSSKPEEDGNQASLIQFSDQRLLLLPVRSLAGTFAWVTSPYILQRLLRDIQQAVHIKEPTSFIPEPEKSEQCLLPENKRCLVVNIKDKKRVCLDALSLEPTSSKPEVVDAWADWIARQVFPAQEKWKQWLIERFCVVHDDVFNFLSQAASEVSARIRLEEDTKTVRNGGLWYEETLPAETVLSGIALATPARSQNGQSALTAVQIFEEIGALTSEVLQLGGKATVGHGLCQVRLAESEA